jgi:hypothetical protein
VRRFNRRRWFLQLSVRGSGSGRPRRLKIGSVGIWCTVATMAPAVASMSAVRLGEMRPAAEN